MTDTFVEFYRTPVGQFAAAFDSSTNCIIATGFTNDIYEMRELAGLQQTKKNTADKSLDLEKFLFSYFEGISQELPSLENFIPSGTQFQMSIWKSLTEIPFGNQVTYSRLAINSGSPGASRAAGTACGSNPLALLIPCHRVVGANGKIGNYRWGSEIKRKLLEHEMLLYTKYGFK